MFGKILLAYDGSKHSVKAAEYAVRLAQLDNSKIDLLHVRDSIHSYSNRVVYDKVALEELLIKDSEKILAKGLEIFKSAGIEVSSKILAGDAAELICDEADKNNYSLVIMGSRGLNPVSRFVLGSVATKVLNCVKSPILIVK